MKKAKRVAFMVLVTVKTLWDVDILKWTFSMLKSFTSGIKLNLFEGPKNHMVAFTHSFVVRRDVMETSEGVSVDTELIKANKYQEKTFPN